MWQDFVLPTRYLHLHYHPLVPYSQTQVMSVNRGQWKLILWKMAFLHNLCSILALWSILVHYQGQIWSKYLTQQCTGIPFLI